MGGGSPPTASSSSASLSQPLSQSQPPSRESVDLSELGRLRALVRYEFPTPPTTDELVEALGAAHNSIHAAYHVLRARRQQQQQQQQQAAAAVVMATPSNKRRTDETEREAPSKRPREDASPPPPTARSLRLSSSQDAEMASPASSQSKASPVVGGGVGYLASLGLQQQQKSPSRPAYPTGDEVRIVFSQRDLSQEAELSQEHSQEQQQQQVPQRDIVVDVVLAPVVDLVRAKRLLDDAVNDRRLKRETPTDANWISSFWDTFGAASSAEITQLLESVCDAMASWLQELDDHEAASRKGKALGLVIDIAAKLPRSDGAGELSQRVVQFEAKGDDSEIAALQQELQHPDAQTSALTRSHAANRAITRLTDECAASMDRIVWFAEAHSANQAHQVEIKEQIQSLQDRLAVLTENCSAEVRAGDSAVAEARLTKEARSSQLRELVWKRREELLAGGTESDVSAEVQAWLDITHSDDLEIAALMDSQTQSGARIRECEKSMEKNRLELVLVEKAAQLFAAVRELREASLCNAMTAFEDMRLASDQCATDALVRCVPVLTLALQKYYEFHSTRQARAKAEADEQQRALETHIEYFGDSAPTTKEDLQKRIREFVGVVSRSMQTIMQVADSQSRLWETRKEALPRAVRQVVVREYGKLWRQFSGPVQDVMQNFVDRMRLEPESISDDPMAGARADRDKEVMSSASSTTAAVRSPALAPSTLSSPPTTQSVQSSVSTADAHSEKASSQSASTAHVSPIRVVDLSMTQEVASFLRQAEPVSSAFAIASAVEAMPTPAATAAVASIIASPSKAPLVMAPVPPAPQILVDESAAHPATHKFQVGATLFTKFGEGKDEHFVRGRVEKLLEDGLYSVAYDNGDVFDVHPSYLHTEAQVERDLELHERSSRDTDASTGSSRSSSNKRDEAGCIVM